ncbi:MAG: filamentous hemagglutinin N-terminal domain-containing protein, partial [Cyanobacteria bacterium J06627_3]
SWRIILGPSGILSTITMNPYTFRTTHSFTEFNVNLDQQINFSSNPAVDSIFTRVTGNNNSQILGTLRVDSDADFFLINPNGIFFGAEAELELGGAFLATTADGIEFGNNFTFSSQAQNTPPVLLTIQPSALLYSRSNSAPIISQARLRGNNGEQIRLIGGDVEIANPGGRAPLIRAREGLIELGGLLAPGRIGLSADGELL